MPDLGPDLLSSAQIDVLITLLQWQPGSSAHGGYWPVHTRYVCFCRGSSQRHLWISLGI